jgi:hypothetical protein
VNKPNYLPNIILFEIASSLLLSILFVALHEAYSLELDENDYIIKNFGLNDTNPFITVEGIAGRSYDISMGDEGYNAYIFDTDKGIYQVTVSYSSSNSPDYFSSRILSNISSVGDCLITEKTNGMTNFNSQTVEYVDSDIQFTEVKRALAIVVSLDDPDEECISGEHVRKIISFATKPIQN